MRSRSVASALRCVASARRCKAEASPSPSVALASSSRCVTESVTTASFESQVSGFIFFTFFSLVSLLVIFPTVIPQSKPVMAQPLYTNSRWIVDGGGQRVKLACVNWVSHLEAMVTEGLSKQPVDAISKKIASMGFNCVRLTWPLFLVTNDSLASVTVRQSFQSLGLSDTISGIQANNPSIIDLPLIKAFQAVVSSLGANNVMVILDNHVSKPGWCCSNSDGNGFFGDKYFNPDLWIKGLTQMATIFNGVSNVVGMSLRNELRGPRQNVNDWYRYMQKGAEAVHSANPDVLVILSGLSYDKDLSFLRNQQVNLTFTGKLVFEMHWYGFSDGQAWLSGNPNQVCGRVVDNMMRLSGFLLDQGWPLLVSEFGMDLRGTNVNDNRYINCFLATVAELDLDWALWTLVGSYYLREGVIGLNEVYGVLDWSWCENRNSSFLERISAVQSPFRGPGLSETNLHKVIFHPLTGLCVLRKSLFEPLRLGPCTDSESWSYSAQKTLTLKGTYFCLQANELENPAKLGIICTDSTSKWETISDSKMHLSTKVDNGSTACLDVDSENTIVVSSCKCLGRDNMCDPGSQWFKLVDSTRSSCSTKSFLQMDSILALPGKDFIWKLLRSALE
nr:endoglucanase e1 [Quercus suber]